MAMNSVVAGRSETSEVGVIQLPGPRRPGGLRSVRL